MLVQSQNHGVAVGVDFHYHLHRVFWTDTVQNKVIRNFRSIAWELIEPQEQSVDSFSFLGGVERKVLLFSNKKGP